MGKNTTPNLTPCILFYLRMICIELYITFARPIIHTTIYYYRTENGTKALENLQPQNLCNAGLDIKYQEQELELVGNHTRDPKKIVEWFRYINSTLFFSPVTDTETKTSWRGR